MLTKKQKKAARVLRVIRAMEQQQIDTCKIEFAVFFYKMLKRRMSEKQVAEISKHVQNTPKIKPLTSSFKLTELTNA